MHDGDTTKQPTPNLTLNQLANLFGFLKTDADNNIISIEPDYVDDQAEETLAEAGGNGTQEAPVDLMDEDD